MFDFKKNRSLVEHIIKQRIGPLCEQLEYVWKRGNWWVKETSWCVKSCNLGLRRVGMMRCPELIGGGSIFFPQYDSIYRREDSVLSKHPSSLGGPVHWIDQRLDSDAGRFDDMAELEGIFPRFESAFQESILPELERYKTENDLLEALLSPDWLSSVKLSATPDARGALVTLMLAKSKGVESAMKWARDEVERIKSETPLVTSTKMYQDILRCIDYLERGSGG